MLNIYSVVGFGFSVGWVFDRGVVDVVYSADGISFGLDDGSDMGSSCGYFDDSNDGKPVYSFIDDNLNTMV